MAPLVKLLRLTRGQIEVLRAGEKRLIKYRKNDERLRERVERLQTIPGVDEILAMTSAVDIGDPHRFKSVKRATSYCVLRSAQVETAASLTGRRSLSCETRTCR